MERRLLFRVGILAASVGFAAVAFFLTSSRDRDEGGFRGADPPEETTFRSVPPEKRFGAAVYFPQGTNPSLGSGISGAAWKGSITVEGAEWEGDSVTAFGVFRDGTPECALTSAPGRTGISATSKTRTAGDAFLFTARPTAEPETSSGPYYVRCTLAGSGEQSASPRDERSVKGDPSSD